MTDPTGTPLPTTDTTASTGEKTVGTVLAAGEAEAETAAETAAPWLLWPVVKQLFTGACSWIFGFINSFLGTLVGYVIMDVQQYLALKNAASALAALQTAQASGDPSAIDQANQNMDSAVAPILQYVGSVKSS